ncbi:hypothetical protein ACX93W_00180 [Paenibacillus sp. CAU 1782]
MDIYGLNALNMMVVIHRPDTPDELKGIFKAFGRMSADTGGFAVFTNERAGVVIVAGRGERHMEQLLKQLGDESGVAMRTEPPQLLYKETIKGAVRGEGKYIRQNSGIDRYAHCVVEFEPKTRGSGLEIINLVLDDAVIRAEFIPSVISGIQRSFTRGQHSGSPVVDIKATIVGGSVHPMDSSNMSYKIAASLAFKEAMKQADIVLLEPVKKIMLTPDGTSFTAFDGYREIPAALAKEIAEQSLLRGAYCEELEDWCPERLAANREYNLDLTVSSFWEENS